MIYMLNARKCIAEDLYLSAATESGARAHLLDIVRSMADEMAGEETSPNVPQSKAEEVAESKTEPSVPSHPKLRRQTSEQARQVEYVAINASQNVNDAKQLHAIRKSACASASTPA